MFLHYKIHTWKSLKFFLKVVVIIIVASSLHCNHDAAAAVLVVAWILLDMFNALNSICFLVLYNQNLACFSCALLHLSYPHPCSRYHHHHHQHHHEQQRPLLFCAECLFLFSSAQFVGAPWVVQAWLNKLCCLLLL